MIKCKCYVSPTDSDDLTKTSGFNIEFCPLHKSAPAMYELLKEIQERIKKQLVIDGLSGEVERRVVKLLSQIDERKSEE